MRQRQPLPSATPAADSWLHCGDRGRTYTPSKRGRQPAEGEDYYASASTVAFSSELSTPASEEH